MTAMAARDDGPQAVGTSPDARGEVWASVMLVTGLSLLHLGMAASLSTLPDAVYDLVVRLGSTRLATFAVVALPWAPLGLVVLWWARTRERGWAASSIVATVVLLLYLRGVVAERLAEPSDFLEVTGWVFTGLLPLAAALAWGLARRRGTRWWPGLLVAAAVALLFRTLHTAGPFADLALSAAGLALVFHVVPAVAAGLTCWWLDTDDDGPATLG